MSVLKPYVLVVDDDQISRLMMRHMLSGIGYETGESCDIAAATRTLETNPPMAVISDLHLTDGLGLQLLDVIATLQHRPRFVLVTGVVNWSQETDPRTAEVEHSLTKPVSIAELKAALVGLNH